MPNPLRYRIITIGKTRKKWIQEGVEIYQNRLPGLRIIELRDGNPQRESEAIRTVLKKDESLIALTEEGEQFTSLSFAKRIEEIGSKNLAFVIGGANGLSTEIKTSAQWCLSLSPFTFPHEIARLLLLEQLYRAQTIHQGAPYHRK